MKCYGVFNLVSDPEYIETVSGVPLVKFRVVHRERFSTKKANEVNEEFFVDAKAWDSAAKLIAKHFRKGGEIFIEGRMRTESWVNKEGENRSKPVLRVEKFRFIGGPENSKGKKYREEHAAATTSPSESHEEELPLDSPF